MSVQVLGGFWNAISSSSLLRFSSPFVSSLLSQISHQNKLQATQSSILSHHSKPQINSIYPLLPSPQPIQHLIILPKQPSILLCNFTYFDKYSHQSLYFLSLLSFVTLLRVYVVLWSCDGFEYNKAAQYSLQTQMRLSWVVVVLAAVSTCLSSSQMESLCEPQHNRKYVDISEARIEKSATFEYFLELFDSPVTLRRNGSDIVFQGNFSRLILANRALRRQFEYWGRELILKMPADHVFSLQKIPDLEVQIVHTTQEHSPANPFRYVLLSQLYMTTKFTSKIETELGRYFHPEVQDGDILHTSKVLKLLKGFPMLMYRGSPESFPCRTDLLCFLKREYQLIAHEDLQQVRALIQQRQIIPKTRAVKRKNLYEIQQMSRPRPQDEEL